MIPTMAGSRTYGGPAYYDSHLPVTVQLRTSIPNGRDFHWPAIRISLQLMDKIILWTSGYNLFVDVWLGTNLVESSVSVHDYWFSDILDQI